MTRMSEFAGFGIRNSKAFRRLLALVRMLHLWTFWAMLPFVAACVVPVAPDFQTPVKAPNYYPYFSQTAPVQDSTYTVPTAGNSVRFLASVGDQNLGDTLYVRWVADYPLYVQGISKVLIDDTIASTGLAFPPSTPPMEIRADIPCEFKCTDFAQTTQQHRLVVIVSDRPFVKAPNFGELRYNQVATRLGPDGSVSPVTNPIMAGWNVVCPL